MNPFKTPISDPTKLLLPSPNANSNHSPPTHTHTQEREREKERYGLGFRNSCGRSSNFMGEKSAMNSCRDWKRWLDYMDTASNRVQAESTRQQWSWHWEDVAAHSLHQFHHNFKNSTPPHLQLCHSTSFTNRLYIHVIIHEYTLKIK